MGITWSNDEVQWYTGNGYNGTELPEKWSYPGDIWQDTHDGANPLSFRIDHHNNYGGTFTDGLSGNNWRVGEGSDGDQYPYCATGNSFFGGKAECEKKDVRYVPYFWGDEECRQMALDIMDTGALGASHFIGHSGPRASGCTEEVGTINASYELRYRFNIGDLNNGDCRFNVEVFLGGRGDRPDGGRFDISTTQVADTGWRTKTGDISVPPHMTIRLTATMTDLTGGDLFSDCGGLSPAASEAYIETLKVRFTHPGTGRMVDRTLIGLKEGSTAFPWPATLHRQNNVAWWEDEPDEDELHIFYAPPFDSVMIKGDTDGGVRGRFYKRVHLLD